MIFGNLYRGKRNIKFYLKIFLFSLLLVPSVSWSFELKNNSSINLSYYKKKINTSNKRISVINKIRFVKEDSQEVNYKKYMLPLKQKKEIPEIAVSRDGSTVVTIKTIKDKNIQEFRLWKLETFDKDAKLKSFGAFQVDLKEFKIDIPKDLNFEEDRPFGVNVVKLSKDSFKDRQKITLSEIAISEDGSKIAFAFRNKDRSFIDLAIFKTENGEKEFLSQVALDKRIRSIQANIPLTCGLAFHPLKSELILCRDASFYKKFSSLLDVRLSSIDLKTGKVLVNGNSTMYENVNVEFANPIGLGLFPTGTLKISKNGKYITTNTKGYCILHDFIPIGADQSRPKGEIGESNFIIESKRKGTWCYKFSSPLAFKEKDLSISNVGTLDDFSKFLYNIFGSKAYKDTYQPLTRECYIKGENNCVKKHILKPFSYPLEKFLKNRKFIFAVASEYMSNRYSLNIFEHPNSGFYYGKQEPGAHSYFIKKNEIERFPSHWSDFHRVSKSSNSLIALSNDESLILVSNEPYKNNERYNYLFSIKDQKLIPIKIFSEGKKLFTAITPVGNQEFVLLGYDIDYVKIKDIKGSIETAYLQQKGIKLLKAGFEEEAMEALLQSYFNNDSWDDSPYMDLGVILGLTMCNDICNRKVETKLPIEFALLLTSKLHSQRIINNSTPLLDESEQQKAERLKNLSYAYFNYALIASYNGQFGLADQAINKLESLINDPANTKLNFAEGIDALINLLKANLIAQSDLKKAYGFLLQKENIAKAWGLKSIGTLESVQTLKQDRKKLCYVLELDEKECKSKYLDKRDYKNHDFVDLDGKLIKASIINKSLPKLKTIKSKSTNQTNSNNPITILD